MQEIKDFDDRRQIAILQTKEDAIHFAADHWIHTAQRSIQQRGRFAAALSGGSTPKAIYELIARKHAKSIDWKKVWLFWSDERAVPPDHNDSNYKMVLDTGFFKTLPIPASQIFRMHGEGNLDQNALNYEDTIKRELGNHLFDCVMLGVGEDGHTASLFPNTEAVNEKQKLVVANRIADSKMRLTLTFTCIEKSALASFYAFGASKAHIVFSVLKAPVLSPFPASRVGSFEKKALWILDQEAAKLIKT